MLTTIFMLSSLLALSFTSLFFFLRCLGHVIKVSHLSPFVLRGFSYITPTFSTSINSVNLKWHWPRRNSPYWLIITCVNSEYKDVLCRISLDRGVVKVWFFPTYFRVTAGPWIETRLEGFTVNVTTSKHIPGYIDRLKKNIVHSVINGETIRLHELKTKIILGEASVDQAGVDGKEVDKAGADGMEVQDKVHVCMSALQWHILASWSSRIYSYNELVAEMRRSRLGDSGSFALIAKDCRWTRIRDFNLEEQKHSQSYFPISFFRTLFSVPSTVLQAYNDPLSMVDIHAVMSNITFSDFHLRDAELLKEAASRVKKEYYQRSHRHPGLMESIAWDLFLNEVLSISRK